MSTGFGQGVRRSIFSIAAILGPLWAGGTVGLSTYYILLGVPLGLLVGIMVCQPACIAHNFIGKYIFLFWFSL